MDFDQHVRVTDADGLTFTFIKPVLYPKDVLNLLEAEPTFRRTNGGRATWQWTFVKLTPPADPTHFEMTFLTGFENERLTQFSLPQPLLDLIPKHMILGFFRSLGRAHVDVKARQVNAAWEDGSPAPAQQALTTADVVRMLGAPLKITEAGDTRVYRYAYELQAQAPRRDPARTMYAICTFAKGDDRLLRAEAVYLTHRLNLHFGQRREPVAAAGRNAGK
jgi:hypothetical protein